MALSLSRMVFPSRLKRHTVHYSLLKMFLNHKLLFNKQQPPWLTILPILPVINWSKAARYYNFHRIHASHISFQGSESCSIVRSFRCMGLARSLLYRTTFNTFTTGSIYHYSVENHDDPGSSYINVSFCFQNAQTFQPTWVLVSKILV